MNILLLCEGDAETTDSWSGVSQSVVRALRRQGHTVRTADVEPAGVRRLNLALRTVSATRRRWWVRFHLGRRGFLARSALAARRIGEAGEDVDVILQIGATFRVPHDCAIPVAMYCDGNISMAREGAESGYSEAAPLTPGEIAEIEAREASVYGGAGLIFTMSHRLRDSFIADFGVPSGRLATIHCGPNIVVDPVERPNPGEGRPAVLFVGRDFHRKGGDLLVQAMERVRRDRPGTRLVVVGPGPTEPGTPLPEWVEVTGYLDRDTPVGREAMDAVYRGAAVFCLPTRYEPFGTSFVEAMMYGLPCVGPDAWAVPEIIVDGETGLLVPPEDTGALAGALTELLSDPERGRRMGSAGRERAATHFSWDSIARRMTAGLDRLLAGDAEPGWADDLSLNERG